VTACATYIILRGVLCVAYVAYRVLTVTPLLLMMTIIGVFSGLRDDMLTNVVTNQPSSGDDNIVTAARPLYFIVRLSYDVDAVTPSCRRIDV